MSYTEGNDMGTRYTYRKDHNYEGAYTAYTRYGAFVAEVDRNGPNDWVAELADGTRGYGRTREDAIKAAKDSRTEAA